MTDKLQELTEAKLKIYRKIIMLKWVKEGVVFFNLKNNPLVKILEVFLKRFLKFCK